MASHPVKHESSGRRAWVTAAMVFSATVFVAAALFWPRAVKPTRLPALTIDTAAAQAAMDADRALAREAPDDRWAQDLQGLVATIGRRAHRSGYANSNVRATYKMLERRVRAVRQYHGERGLWALRAKAVLRLDAALAHEMPESARHALLGKFEEQLTAYQVRSDTGVLRAPPIVVWAMFKARWNFMCGQAPTAAFAPVEVQAYDGWLALHAVGAPEKLRYEAAQRFERAGGHRGAEAVAVWAMFAGQPSTALEALARAQEASPSVRLRNYALALQQP